MCVCPIGIYYVEPGMLLNIPSQQNDQDVNSAKLRNPAVDQSEPNPESWGHQAEMGGRIG